MAPFESTISIGSTIESLANDSDTPKEVDNIGFDYVKFHDEDANKVIAVEKLMDDGLLSISKMKNFAAKMVKRKVHLIELYVKDFDHKGCYARNTQETFLTDDDAVAYALKEALKHYGSDSDQSFSVFIKTPKWPEFIHLVYVGCDTKGAQPENCEDVGLVSRLILQDDLFPKEDSCPFSELVRLAKTLHHDYFAVGSRSGVTLSPKQVYFCGEKSQMQCFISSKQDLTTYLKSCPPKEATISFVTSESFSLV